MVINVQLCCAVTAILDLRYVPILKISSIICIWFGFNVWNGFWVVVSISHRVVCLNIFHSGRYLDFLIGTNHSELLDEDLSIIWAMKIFILRRAVCMYPIEFWYVVAVMLVFRLAPKNPKLVNDHFSNIPTCTQFGFNVWVYFLRLLDMYVKLWSRIVSILDFISAPRLQN